LKGVSERWLAFLLKVGSGVLRVTVHSLNAFSLGLLAGQDQTAEDGLAVRRVDAAGEAA
jgi:hypothetical protein